MAATTPARAAPAERSTSSSNPNPANNPPPPLQQQQEQEDHDQQEEQSPRSPPLPTKHTPVTPGPRAQRLQEAFDNRLRHTLAKLSWDNVAACYPTIAARAPATLRAVQSQMGGLLAERCNKEFSSILTSRNVIAKLNELEGLVHEAARRKTENRPGGEPPVPPHLLPANAIFAAHLAPHLASQQGQLNARLQTVQAHNVRLFGEIQDQRDEIARLLAAVEKVLADMDGANGLLDQVVDELAKEARDVEVEMAEM